MFLDVLIKNFHASISRYPEVLRYLYSRHVTNEEIKKYEIGYKKIVGIPEDPGEDRKRMMSECYNGRKLERKIIFPIKNLCNITVGLIGRTVESKEFKIFVNGEAKYTGFFFGLQQALPHIYKENRVYIVEGPFDYFALVKVFPNTVAVLTSRLSEVKYGLLRKYCDTIVTVFDSDKAGKEGMENALEYEGVVQMGTGAYKDPALCLKSLSLSKFKKFMQDKAPLNM